MDLFNKIDDFVWGESEDVWNNTIALLIRETPGMGSLVDVVMRCIWVKYEEYRNMYHKVLDIYDGQCGSDGVLKLLLHYQKIMSRYRSAYNSCKAYEYAL
jgi:hypothetical protein